MTRVTNVVRTKTWITQWKPGVTRENGVDDTHQVYVYSKVQSLSFENPSN